MTGSLNSSFVCLKVRWRFSFYFVGQQLSHYLPFILTALGEPKERFADPDVGSLSSGSSAVVSASEALVILRVGVTGYLSFLEIDCFFGVVGGALAKDVPDVGS